jgi:hypothetical protein
MSGELLERPATLDRVHLLHERAGLPTEAHEAAVRQLTPAATAETWKHTLDRALLQLGAAQIVAGVVYAVAWNAAAIGPLSWLVVLQLVFLGVAGVAIWRGTDHPVGRTAAISALLLIGPQLALVGQTYQTGANSWLLFGWWAALGLPLVLGSRSARGWVSWTVIATTAAVLWVVQTTRQWEPQIGWTLLALAGLLPLLTGMGLLAAARRWPWADSTGAQRALVTLHTLPWGLAAAAHATGFFPSNAITWTLSTLVLVSAAWRYERLWRLGHDVYGAGLACLAVLVAGTTWLTARLIEVRFGPEAALLVGVLVLGQGLALTTALRAALGRHLETS